MNNVFQSEFRPSPQVHQSVEKRINEIIEKKQYPINVNELTEIINYLYQASTAKGCEINEKLYK